MQDLINKNLKSNYLSILRDEIGNMVAINQSAQTFAMAEMDLIHEIFSNLYEDLITHEEVRNILIKSNISGKVVASIIYKLNYYKKLVLEDNK